MILKKFSEENKKEIINTTIFLLIHVAILLIALSCIYMFIALPLLKEVWNDIIYSNDNTIIQFLKNVGKPSGATSKPPDTTSDDEVNNNNTNIENKAITISLILSIVIIGITTIIVYFTEYKYITILFHACIGFLVIAITYSLYSYFFIRNYNSLDTFKAIQHYLIIINNYIYPNDQIDDI